MICMQVLVPTESQFYKTRSGQVFPIKNPFLDYDFWVRYLDVFSEVFVTGRIEDVERVSGDFPQANGEGVYFIALPTWDNPWEYLMRRQQVVLILRENAQDRAVCLRSPTQVSVLMHHHLEAQSKPYGVEVVGDPWDALGPGTVKTVLRPFLRWKFSWELKRVCRNAAASAYVTATALQKRYPPETNAFTTHFSSIVLHDDAFVSNARTDFRSPFHLIHVGSMAKALYKAQDDILYAYKIVQNRLNHEVCLTFVGDGERRDELKRLASRLGVADNINFTGLLPGPSEVRAKLDRADLFLLPSRTEGLPKALIEAMARGLPAIGTRIGGIPELLTDVSLVPPDNPEALAGKIVSLLQNPILMADLALENLQRARDYHIDDLRERRVAYYEKVREMTRTWMKKEQLPASTVEQRL